MHKIEFWKTPAEGTLVPVIDTMPADLLTPLAVYLKLSAEAPNSFLLESVEGGESVGRYSFIGSDPVMIVTGNGSSTTVHGPINALTWETSMFSSLRSHFSTCNVECTDELPPFIGGAIGYLGFNCSGWFEPSVGGVSNGNIDSEFMFFRTVVSFDHAKQIISIISLVSIDEDVDLEEAENRNAAIRSRLETGSIEVPASHTSRSFGPVASNWTKEDFENAVRMVKELIAAGECYQVVLSQCFSRRTSADPVSIYRAMRSLNPSPYMFLLKFADRSIIGASPEMLVKCMGRDLEYRPIAGTRPRGTTAEEDARFADEMRVDQKEVAEHLMLVDLGRNDLGRVAEYGSVKVDGLMSVEKYSHVQHLVSYLSARLRPDLDRFDALAACFPAGTVSGAPKVRAIEIIQSMEPTSRGIYAGAVGYLDYGGNMDMCIAIRTLVLKDGVAYVQAGAGIVADSVPEAEYQETVNKARALLKAVEIAEGGVSVPKT
ncbi:MAG TPA: anthranilate synthase component I [Pyrinomonadaceae bacterium]